MSFKRYIVRYGHTNGYTFCHYTEKGERILSCGTDGDYRSWDGMDDDDPQSQCVGESANCLWQYRDRLLVATDVNTVQSYIYPDGGRDGIEFRFTAPITSIKANPTFIAASSEDMTIKVVRADKSEETFELLGHEGPVLHIDLDSTHFLASSSGDGTIKIWNLSQKKEIKTISGFPKVFSFDGANIMVTPSFDKNNGHWLAYPLEDEIVVMDTKHWNINFRLKDKNITADYCVCSFSPCGELLAAATTKGEFSIWNLRSGNCLKGETKSSDDFAVTSLAWNPLKNGEIVFTDNTGQLCMIHVNIEDEREYIKAFNEAPDADDIYNDIDFQDDEAEEDNENCVSLSKLKRETMKSDLDDELNDLPERPGSVMSSIAPVAKSFPMQPLFQPSATPGDGGGSKYFAWNNVGIIALHSSDVDNNIHVDFHDASVHHAIHMKNYFNYTMGSLSKNVVALAGNNPCKLTGITFKAFGSKEWSVDITEFEEILAIAASDKLVAIATDTRLLRLFSTMGTQREVFTIPGPVVAIAAHDDKVMVAYHTGPATEDQHISLMLVQAIGYNLRCRDIKMPLSANAKLTWLGYSDKGSPISYDSHGILRIYSMKSNLWYPICETTQYIKGVSDGYYIVDVSEANQICRAVMCRGKSYPSVSPKPIVTSIKLEIPLCEMTTEKGELEEELVRYSILNVENADKLFKERAIKLFAAACKAEAEFRARDLVEIIASPQFVELAVRYATKMGRIHLSERIMEMLPNIEEREKENEKTLKQGEETLLLNTSVLNNSILLATKERLNKTPNTIPKPLLISQQKRNPFKRNSLATPPISDSKSKPLVHLTSNAVGFEGEDELLATPLNDSNASEKFVFDYDNLENMPHKIKKDTPTPTPTFAVWYLEIKTELEMELPELDNQELTKEALKRYKNLRIHKRKMEEIDKKVSGVSKLARFGFTTE